VQLDAREEALATLGRMLRESGYQFVTITPETHRRVRARYEHATTLRDVFGWSRVFDRSVVPAKMFGLLERADAVVERGTGWASLVRFSTLGDHLFVHSAYPTTDASAVFFGPDTYRFCSFLRRSIERATRVVDVCAGCGAGGLCIADRVDRIVLADVNPIAASYARVNAVIAGLADRVEIVVGDLFANIAGDFDLAVANPPYLVDRARRTYRDGGGELGMDLALRIVDEGLSRLVRGGQLVLYTGAPVVDGIDRARQAVLARTTATWTYEELDPDVFGDELDTPAYARADRIAAIGAIGIKR
jgi:release factor glutamine methyltransferase